MCNGTCGEMCRRDKEVRAAAAVVKAAVVVVKAAVVVVKAAVVVAAAAASEGSRVPQSIPGSIWSSCPSTARTTTRLSLSKRTPGRINEASVPYC